MTEKEDEFKFYSHGIFYKTEEELYKATEQWAESPASEDTCKYITDGLAVAIFRNLEVYKLKIPNARLSYLLHEAIYKVIEELVHKRENREP